MKKIKINEIFYSLQGEGYFAGKPAVFVRFSGCNIRCPFCDTEHQKGVLMSEDEIIEKILEYPCNHIVFTGGEPTLFITEELCEKLHKANKFIQVETNGTNKLVGVDWITLSPKFEFTQNAEVVQTQCNELKVVFNSENDMRKYDNIKAEHRFVQPCDTLDSEYNQVHIINAIRFVREHPEWRLSLQIHKFLNIR